jgi:hypothetical protein
MRKLSISLLLLALAVTPFLSAQTQCSAINNQTFTSSLLNPSGPAAGGFANATLRFDQSGAGTLQSSTLGLGDNITSFSLFRGDPANGGVLVQTFPTSASNFQNGRFSTNVMIDPATAAMIEQNPGSFVLVANSMNGSVVGTLSAMNTSQFSGALAANGAFGFSLKPLANGNGFMLNYDIQTSGLSNNVSSFQLMSQFGTPITIAENPTGTNGRFIGSAQISTAAGQALICNPSSFTLSATNQGTPVASGAVGAATEIFIPAAGTARGIGDTNFMTELNLFDNDPAGSSASIFVQFFPTLTPDPNAADVSAFNIRGRATVASHDIGSTIFNGNLNGIGALRILSSSNNVFASARVYNNQVQNGRGTFGQMVPGLTRSQALTEGALIGLINTNPSTTISAASARTNVGFFNPNDTSTFVAIELRDGGGNIIGRSLVQLGPFEHAQLPLAGANGLFSVSGDIDTSTAYFVSGAPVFAYASVVDNVSGDGSYVSPSIR